MKKFEHKTKDERRRVLLSKNNELSYTFDNKKLPECIGVYRQNANKKVLAIVLAIVFCFSGVISLLVSAFDGADINNAQTIAFSNGVYTVPSNGLDKNEIYTFINNGKKYAFVPKYNLPEGDTLTLNPNNTITLNHDPTRNAEPLTDYVDVVSSTSPYQFTIKDQKKLSAGQRYYYTPDETNYYTFTPEEDIGYSSVMIRENGVYVAASVGNIVLTLDSSTGAFTAIGEQYTRHVIYEESDRLQENHVYLIAVESGGTFNGSQDGTNMLVTYYDGDSKEWSDIGDNVNLTQPSGCANRHYRFNHSNDPLESAQGGHALRNLIDWGDVGEYVYHISATAENPQRSYEETLYSYKNGVMSEITVLRPFYNGEDGTLEKDPYVYNEFSTYSDRSVPSGILTENARIVLRAYDGDGSSRYYDSIANGWNDEASSTPTEGYYSSFKTLGGVYSTSPSKAGRLLLHKFCNASGFIADHNHGNVWGYNSTWHSLYNGNASINFGNYSDGPAVDVGYPIFFDFDGSKYCINNYFESITQSIRKRKAKETYIYEMKDVYTKKDINVESTLYTESNEPTVLTPYELENVTVTLSYNGNPSAKEFGVTFTLKDDSDPKAPVSGKWSTEDLTFTDGVYQTTMKNGDSIPFTNIPKGYSLDVSVALPNGTGEDNPLYYSATIDNDSVLSKTFTINEDRTGNNAIPIVITDSRKKAHISLTVDGDNPDLTQTYPVTLTLLEADGTTPVAGTFVGTDVNGASTTYTFDSNGQCSVGSLSNGQSLDVYTPEGYKLTTAVTLPSDTTYITSTVNRMSGTSATVTMDAQKDIPIVITSVKERVTITNYTTDPPGQNYADTTKEFPLKLTLFHTDGITPYEGSFVGTDGTTYTFGQDGVCTNTVDLKDQESISLFLPKDSVLKVEDATPPADYTTTYADSSPNSSSDPLNTAISSDGIQIEVTHTRKEIVITGLLTDSNKNILVIISSVIGIALAAGVAYLYRKKDEFVE